jgi:hypothetical protein
MILALWLDERVSLVSEYLLRISVSPEDIKGTSEYLLLRFLNIFLTQS